MQVCSLLQQQRFFHPLHPSSVFFLACSIFITFSFCVSVSFSGGTFFFFFSTLAVFFFGDPPGKKKKRSVFSTGAFFPDLLFTEAAERAGIRKAGNFNGFCPEGL